MFRFTLPALLLAGLFVSVIPTPALAALPAGFETETLTGGLNLPTQMTFAADGRIFIAEKDGTVVVWKNGALLPTPVIKLTDVNSYGDRGLLGIAIDPQFATNNYMYLLYTRENTPGTNFAGKKTGRIVRVTLVGDIADESTKVTLVGSVGGTLATPSCADYATTSDCIPSDSASHSVGGLRFGPDGKLYATFGEGANFDYADPYAMRAQDLDSLGGKMIRINTDGTAPADNPFYNGSSTANRSKVWVYGLRNDFRFNFRASTGSLFSGDVGWSSWEEVNKIVAGGNYGWPCYEGVDKRAEFNCNVVGMKTPLYSYAHDVNGAGSVTAGAFGSAYPLAYQNSLFIGDYAQNWIKRVILDGSENFVSVQDFMSAADGSDGPVDITAGPDGNVYFLSIYTGELKRILYTTGNRQPIAVMSATPTSGSLPLSVTFNGAASSDPDNNPLTYLWNFGDGATSTSTNPVHVYTTQGNYTAALTVFDGQGGQNTKSVTIFAGNRAPTATIIAPSTGGLYKVGDNIALSGTAVDPEDGTLSGASLVWTIILHHNTHIHILQTLTGTNPSFPAPDHNDTDVYTEVRLTVTDSGGLSTSKSVNIYLDNFVPTLGNQILNPSLETPSAGSATSPDHWAIGGYGINAANYLYPVAGFDGSDAAQVTVTSYTDGDVKWVHEPITVSGGHSYDFSGYYKSNAAVGIILQIGYGDGTYTYYNLGDILPAANWTRVDRTFMVPAGGTSAMVAFPLTSVGQMSIDLFSIQSTPTGIDTTAPSVAMVSPLNNQTVSGIVTLVASSSDNVGVSGVRYYIDNIAVGNQLAESPYAYAWNSQSVANGTHTVRAVSRDAAGNSATSSPITLSVLNQATGGATSTQNLILNPSVETAGTGGKPLNWLQAKYGTNSTTFAYPVAGFDGARAMQVNVATYSNGAARWYFADAPVTPGANLQFSDYYKSTGVSTVMIRYTLTSGAFGYVTLGTLPAQTNWTKAQYNFTVPAGVVSMTVLHSLYNVGVLSTDMYTLGTAGAASDTTKPTVAISTPVSGATLKGVSALRAQAGDLSGVAGVQFYLDNVKFGSEVLTSPYELAFDSTLQSNATHSLFAVARDAAGNVATSSAVTFTVNNAIGGGGDTTLPVVTITAPASGATVSGIVAVNGNATDNVGVTSLQFKVDNVLVASGVTPAFSFNWNTASSTNGAHTVTVTAFDAAGNNNFALLPLTVSNSTSTATTTLGPNLIPNGNFETANGANPLGWNKGGWGTNDRTFTYPVTGQDGLKGARVAMTTYTSGDAKWYFNKIAVTPGTLYNFSGWYKSSTIMDVIGEYTMSNGTLLYVGIAKENQPTANWVKMSADFTPPVGATQLTLYPLISAVGTLDIDDFSINAKGTTTVNTDTEAPLVAMTAPANNATVSGTINISASSTDNVAVTKLWFAVDGNVVSPVYASAPYTFALNTTLLTNGAHVLKATAEDAVGNNNTGTSTIIVNNSTSTPDTTKPLITLTNPTSGSTVSGDVALSASSSDNIAVVGVKFFVDAVQQGSEDLTTPYTTTWSTLSATNGSHIVTAVSRDAAGNTATATSTVTVNNSVATTTNLIANPSVETGTTLPTGWAQGGWGTNNRVLSYPVAGQDGAKAVAMTITTFTDGDAKWYFNPVNIATGTSYTYSDYYKSDVGTTLTARYTLVGGTFSYVFLGNVPAAANWTKTSVQFVPPVNATAVTIFHALSSVGTLSVDNFSLAPSSGVNPNTFANGMVSLSFDDGWVSHYTTVMPMLNTAGLKGSFGIITSYMLNTVPANPIANFSLETTGTASTPQDWFKGGWGTNDAVLTWPVAGFSGAKAAQLSITTYTDGDAKWYFKDVSVVDGQKFTFSDYYKSTATSTITARYFMGSSTYVYAQLAVVPPSASWATQPVQFTVPANVQSMTIFHALSSVGTLTIDLANLDDGNPQPYVSSGQVLDMQASGHEIDSHTQTHVSLSTVPVVDMQNQISGSRSDLLGIGVTAPEILVYPYGDYNAAVEQTAQTTGFIGARSVDRGFNLKNTDKYALKVQQIDIATPLSQLIAWVDQAKQDKTWLIFMFHQVDTGGEELSISPADLQTLVNYIKASGVTVPTLREGVQQMAL